MAATTRIEWAANADGSPGATWNPVRARRIDPGPHHGMTGTHCVHASEGCRNCYAERWNNRALPGAGTGLPYAKQSEAKLEIFLDEKMLAAPLRRRKPTTWFLSSMSDVFADFVTDDMLDRLFAVMALSPQHTFIVLTKRARRMRDYVNAVVVNEPCRINEHVMQMAGAEAIDTWSPPLPNVWLGVSAEDQKTADERIPDLLATPAAIRLLSAEPLLGPMDLTLLDGYRAAPDLIGRWDALGGRRGVIGRLGFSDEKFHEVTDVPRLDWVIVGGESGPDARPMHPDWARSLRDQCTTAGVPFFMKQWGEWAEANPGPEHTLEIVETRGPNRTPKPGAFGSPLEKGDALIAHDGHTVFDFGAMRDEVKYRRMQRVGKARAGRLLDGVEHNARPPISEPKGEARLTKVEGRKGEALATRSASPGRPAQ